MSLFFHEHTHSSVTLQKIKMWQIFSQTSSSYTAAGFCVGQPACSEVVTHEVWQQRATGVPTRDDLQVSD